MCKAGGAPSERPPALKIRSRLFRARILTMPAPTVHALVAKASLLKTKHVFHAVKSRRTARQPRRGEKGAAREHHAVMGPMRELDALAVPGQHRRVLPDHIAGAQRGEADASRPPRPGAALPLEYREWLQLRAARAGNGLAPRERRAGGRIALRPMVDFEDLRVVAAERARRDFDEVSHDGDAE